MNDILYRIRLLMVIRIVAVTALLVAVLLVELWSHPARNLHPLYILTAATYVLTIIYGLLYPVLLDRSSFIHLQLAGDILTCTGFVYITGTVSSPFSFLYVPVIIAGGMLLYRRGAYMTAALSCIAYGVLVALLVGGRIPAYPAESFGGTPAEVKRAGSSALVHFLGFGLVGLLASGLSESLRRTGEELGVTLESLEDLQAFNALIIDSVNSGLVTTDAEDKITFLNRSAREITGLSESSIHGRTLQDLFDLEPTFGETLRQTLAREGRFRFETSCHVSPGLSRELGFTAGVLRDKSGVALGHIFTFQDLTEIKSLEREILQRERMAAVGEMAAGMAHELRNPLASMSGSVQVLRAALPEHRQKERELLEIIQRESLRLDHVLKEFLAFARPRPFRPQRADLGLILEEFVRLLENSPEVCGSHQIVRAFPRGPLPCRVDVNRIKQVMWNLATNALRAMPDGGRLTISADPTSGGEVTLAFMDTGCGMSPEQIRTYFRPFQSTFQNGTGLGSAIVYRIVHEHGGRIGVDSEPGRGTRVSIILPSGMQPGAGREWKEGWTDLTHRAS
ncbi:MAG: nitrogen regulation protein NR(II) [Acidobacteriota bacterium]